ncbi:MAG: phage integrase SAM-like domain-containing protein [Rhodobacteraceae bacterium]|nr:phage integrase SAM-like domain-containing protein [Paracoccaceae bacterium]
MVKKLNSFEHYANKYSENIASTGKAGAMKDVRKIINRPTDGLLAYFGKHEISKITRNDMHDFLTFLNGRRDKPLAASTQKKQCIMLRNVLGIALDDGVINVQPPMPKIGTENKPRASFTDREYMSFMRTLRQSMASGDVVKGAAVTHEWEAVFLPFDTTLNFFWCRLRCQIQNRRRCWLKLRPECSEKTIWLPYTVA